LKKGLLAGERLHYDLKRLETAYYEQNRREYELTKHISLEQLDPIALLKLRQNGECFLDIPETVFDMDYPSHYFPPPQDRRPVHSLRRRTLHHRGLHVDSGPQPSAQGLHASGQQVRA